jgi:hypothetical protein
MKIRISLDRFEIPRTIYLRLALVLVLGALSVTNAPSVFGQQQLSKRYPAGKKVRVELRNISGTIIVESWNRDEIKLSAVLESPKANVSPRQMGDALIVDVMADNRGRSDVGDVNFKLMVPVNSSVDLETKRGQITVSNIRGESVRAHVSLEGDIELINIGALKVIAQNTIGDIFFDGEFARGGSYQFQSNKGNISIRIPADSAFNLVAAAPNRRIVLGEFWNNGLKNLGDGRKVTGDVRDGRSSVAVTNFQGSITFHRR